MLPRHHIAAAAIVALASTLAVLWLLLFAGPALLNTHSDGATLAAAFIYLGVPAVVAWGGTRLWTSLSPKDHDDD